MNPIVKTNDKIILLKARNGYTNYVGKELTVLAPVSAGASHFNARANDGTIVNIYVINPIDEYCFANKESQIEYYTQKLELIEKESKYIKDKLLYLKNFDSHEQFVAHKLDKILVAHASSGDQNERIKAITAVLKELQESSLL